MTFPVWFIIVMCVLIVMERWSTGYRDKLALKLYDISADREVRHALRVEREVLRNRINGIAYRLANKLPPDAFELVEDVHADLGMVAESLAKPVSTDNA